MVGSGCAGLSAAMVVSEYGFRTAIFSGPIQGGDLNAKTPVGNWPGVDASMGHTIIETLVKQAERFGAEFIPETINSVDFSKKPFELVSSSGKTYRALKVVIATGTTERMLNIPGAHENRSKLLYNWDIHRDVQAYMSSCHNKKVAFIGGGIDMAKKAHYAQKGGASEIQIFLRGKELKLPPWRKQRFMQKSADLITIHTLSELSQLQERDGKLRLFFKDKDKATYDADIVVVSIGRVPCSSVFKNAVEIDGQGFIVVNTKTQETNVSGVYACGDVTDACGPQPQASIAAGDGMLAGYTVVEELMKEQCPQTVDSSPSKRSFQQKRRGWKGSRKERRGQQRMGSTR